MPALTAILYTHNDALRIARAIESLRPCDEVLVIDRGSSDETCRVALEFGARVVIAAKGSTDDYVREARHDWVLTLLPTESLSEALEASLYEWRMHDAAQCSEDAGYAVEILEETNEGWQARPAAVRLTHRSYANSREIASEKSRTLEGPVLRLRLP